MTNLLRSEWLKLRTTNMWWLLLLGTLIPTGMALLQNIALARYQLAKTFDDYLDQTGQDASTMSATELESARHEYQDGNNLIEHAANIYTSGQAIGVLIVTILGVLLVTNEFQHQTATATFLTSPHRSPVVFAKLVIGVLAAVAFCVFTTVVDITAGALVLTGTGFDSALGEWEVQRALLLNLAAYAVWGMFGVGLGALVRNQIGATVTAVVAYVGGTVGGLVIFQIVHAYLIKEDWVLAAQVILPSIASTIMITPGKLFDQAPPQWAGAAVLIAYGVLASSIGIALLRRRDIS